MTTQRLSVAHVNAAFPKYPITVDDKGWVYGVWYCGTGWQKVVLHGQYPPGFLKRALALFPDARDVLHAPSGTLGPEWGTTVDLVVDAVRKPMYQASVAALPFADNSFDLYISDPPYTDEDSKKYGTPPFPMRAMMSEAKRVLRGGGAPRNPPPALSDVPPAGLGPCWAHRRRHGGTAHDADVQHLPQSQGGVA